MRPTAASSPTAEECRTTRGKRSLGRSISEAQRFGDRMQTLVETKERSREHPRPQRRFVRPAFETLVEVVTDSFNVTTDALRLKSRGQARKALAQLAVDEAGLTLRAIAGWMGVSEWAASKMRRSGRELYVSDRLYRERIDRIKAELS